MYPGLRWTLTVSSGAVRVTFSPFGFSTTTTSLRFFIEPQNPKTPILDNNYFIYKINRNRDIINQWTEQFLNTIE